MKISLLLPSIGNPSNIKHAKKIYPSSNIIKNINSVNMVANFLIFRQRQHPQFSCYKLKIDRPLYRYPKSVDMCGSFNISILREFSQLPQMQSIEVLRTVFCVCVCVCCAVVSDEQVPSFACSHAWCLARMLSYKHTLARCLSISEPVDSVCPQNGRMRRVLLPPLPTLCYAGQRAANIKSTFIMHYMCVCVCVYAAFASMMRRVFRMHN